MPTSFFRQGTAGGSRLLVTYIWSLTSGKHLVRDSYVGASLNYFRSALHIMHVDSGHSDDRQSLNGHRGTRHTGIVIGPRAPYSNGFGRILDFD
jgi:hypothetical protein